MNHYRFVVALALLIGSPLFATQPTDKIANKSSLHPYIIEPPDVLSIELSRLVPKAYRVAAFDVLTIHVVNSLPNAPLDTEYMVLDDGTIDLGSRYGSVHVAGMTIDDARDAIDAKLRKSIGKPDGSVVLTRASRAQPVTGQYLVGPDGTINRRDYGVVHVAGTTVAEARVLIKDQMKRFLDSPEPSVDVAACNSKVYYVITRAGQDDIVRRLPVTGNETVLDAVSQLGGLTDTSHKKMWIARPAPNDFGGQKILSIDWDGIAQGSSTETNYQLLPGDRLYIAEVEIGTKSKATKERGSTSGTTGSDSTVRVQSVSHGYNRIRNGL